MAKKATSQKQKEQIWGTGRRKKAVARVRIMAGDGKIIVNKVPAEDYFKLDTLLTIVKQPLVLVGADKKYDVMVNVYVLSDIIRPILEVFKDGKNENDYLTNCLNANKTYTNKQQQSRVTNYYVAMKKHLNEYLQKTAKSYNIKIEDFSYYSARHTLTNYLINNNIDESTIKRLIGHKDSTLTKYYIADIDKICQANLIAEMFNKCKKISEL